MELSNIKNTMLKSIHLFASKRIRKPRTSPVPPPWPIPDPYPLPNHDKQRRPTRYPEPAPDTNPNVPLYWPPSPNPKPRPQPNPEPLPGQIYCARRYYSGSAGDDNVFAIIRTPEYNKVIYTGERPDTTEEGMKKCIEMYDHAEVEELNHRVKYAALTEALHDSHVIFYCIPKYEAANS